MSAPQIETRPMKPFRRYLLALAALTAAPVLAHGDWLPQHGGVIGEEGETTFELLHRGRQVVFYLSDHGTDLLTDGAKGFLTVTQARTEVVVPVLAAGGNRLEGRLPFGLMPGATLNALITLGNGSVVVGRFTVRPAKRNRAAGRGAGNGPVDR